MMLNRLFKLAGITLFLASLGVAWLAMEYNTFKISVLNIDPAGLNYEIRQGMTLTSIVKDMSKMGVLDKPAYFRWMARFQGTANDIKAGEYFFPASTTPLQLLDIIVTGKVVQYSLTIVEGWNFKQLMDAVNSNEHLAHTLPDTSGESVMTMLGYPDMHPEGRFYPDTYLFPKNTKDSQFLKRAFEAMTVVLEKEWQQKLGALPFKNAYEALILASIVEKETALPSERKAIAGVFIRRLEKNMRLQTDPTVIYGMGDKYKGNIRLRDLKRDTPYNTYRRKGLPPTPIAMPGGASINAALHPQEGDALYFVARGDGSHAFSSTLDQHNNAVIKYQLKGRKRAFSSSPDIKKPNN